MLLKKEISWIKLAMVLIISLIMIINPNGFLQLISYIISIFLSILGIEKVYKYYKIAKTNDNFVYGVILILIAIIVISFPSLIETIFRIPIGLFILYSGIMKLEFILRFHKRNTAVFAYNVIIFFIIILMGIYIIVNSNILVITIGFYLLLYTILCIIDYFLLFVKK